MVAVTKYSCEDVKVSTSRSETMKKSDYIKDQEKLNRWHKADELVLEQAEDEGLWFITDDITIAYLQQELRRLHAVIEGENPKP